MLQTVDKQAVAVAFGRAATCYNQHAELQRQCGERLMALARSGSAMQVLDAGCGTGWFSQRWQQNGHRVTALDLSAEMLRQAEASAVATDYRQGDIEALPFADASFDRCWSNLAVQWCSDLKQGLSELYRVTRPGGQVLFSTLEAGALPEVASAWRALGAVVPLNPQPTVDEIARAGCKTAMQLHRLTLTLAYPDALSALRSLKGTGVSHLHQGRAGIVLNRQRLEQLEQVWSRDERGYLLSWKLILGVIERE
ncbi:malonyl-ACP O-methyltransferase BioC [Erwiniaceae bacterium CAU 1747]